MISSFLLQQVYGSRAGVEFHRKGDESEQHLNREDADGQPHEQHASQEEASDERDRADGRQHDQPAGQPGAQAHEGIAFRILDGVTHLVSGHTYGQQS